MKPKILCLTITFAIFAHALFIYLLKEMKIDFYSSRHASMEHQGTPFVSTENVRLEKAKRDKQLAQVFKALSKPSHEIASLHSNCASYKPASLSSLEATADLNLKEIPPAEFPASDVSFIDQTEMKNPSVVESLRDWEICRVCPTQETNVMQDLIKATERLSGNMDDTRPESLDSIHTIKVGFPDEAFLDGNAWDNSSGWIDRGELFSQSITKAHSEDLKLDILQQTHSTTNITDFFSTESREVELKYNDNASFISSEYGTIAGSHDFDVRIEYSPSRTREGYIFRLELVPKESVFFKRIKQNLFFLIDRSHSIREKRYEASKNAVLKVLKMLQPGDTFNILVFDKNIVRLSKNNLPWSPEAIAKAEQFLLQQQYGGLFATTDLYSSIGNIVPDAVAENEVNTAILLSDGDTYLKTEKQRETISKWTQKNSGKVSLYSLASGKGNNLPLLDILSSFNKGSLHYAPSDDLLENSLLALMESIKNPIGKDIFVTAICPEGVTVKIHPMSSRLPNLYEHTPFIVYGSISEMKDFTIFFQGKYYDKWLDIKQTVSFEKATTAQKDSLERMWAIYQAYEDYALYLKDGNPNHLAHARQTLAPFHLPLAFE